MSKVKIPLQTLLLLGTSGLAWWSQDRHDYLAFAGWASAFLLTVLYAKK